MSKNYKLTTILLFFSSLLGFAQTDITFQVDFGATDPPAGKEFKIGGQLPGTTGFNGTLVALTDVDDDGIYTGTLTVSNAGRLLFRLAQADTGSTGFGGGFSWVSDINSLSCSLLEKEASNYKTNVIPGVDKTLSFVNNQCISEVITWNNSATTNDWNTPANWVGGVVPSANNSVLINEGTASTNYPTVTSGSVNVRNIVMQNQTSLIVNNGATFSGEIMYRRFLPGSGNWFSLASPFNNERIESFLFRNPILDNTGATKKGLAPYDNTQTDVNLRWAYTNAASTGDLTSGKGYIVQRSSAGFVEFIGNLNTSTVSTNVSVGAGTAFNFIGNPYTSYLNSQMLLEAYGGGAGSVADIIDKTIWVWDGANATYVSRVAAQAFRVAPTQGFFVRAKASGTLDFDLSNQAHAISLTFQKQAPKTEIKLVVDNGSVKRQMNLLYLESASKGFDNGSDGELFNGSVDSFELYSHLLNNSNDKKYQVQSLPNKGYQSMVVPIGLKVAANSKITFSAETLNFPENLSVLLEDRLDNTFTDLKEIDSQYSFTASTALDGTGRFYIHTVSKSILSTLNESLENVNIYTTNNLLKVSGLSESDASIKIYNILGKEVFNSSLKTDNNQISLPKLSSGVYIVRLNSTKGKLTRKIVLK